VIFVILISNNEKRAEGEYNVLLIPRNRDNKLTSSFPITITSGVLSPNEKLDRVNFPQTPAAFGSSFNLSQRYLMEFGSKAVSESTNYKKS
jgi:hypothetical protein